MAKVTKFKSGATRSSETTFDPFGFISPAVWVGFCRYMEKHRFQADGGIRASDNWQKGMPTSRAWRSLTRHFFDAWLLSRGYPAVSADCKSIEDALHAILFNVSVILKNRIDRDDHEQDGRPSKSAERWRDRPIGRVTKIKTGKGTLRATIDAHDKKLSKLLTENLSFAFRTRKAVKR